MNNYDASMANMYSTPSTGSSVARKIGGAVVGGMLGMTAYYIPVSKDVFVNKAFSIHSENVNADINSLKQAATEIGSSSGLSTENKIFLNKLAVSENLTAIIDKCKTLEESIKNSTSVKNITHGFADGFESFKKNASGIAKFPGYYRRTFSRHWTYTRYTIITTRRKTFYNHRKRHPTTFNIHRKNCKKIWTH